MNGNSPNNFLGALREYMNEVFDRNSDGLISLDEVKEALSSLPNFAVAVAMVFLDVMVIASEYRVWQFGVSVTKDYFLAVGFVLASAVPFFVGQIFWLYPRAVLIQKIVGGAFVFGGLYTSAVFGFADLSKSYDINEMFKYLVYIGVAYIAGTILFIVFDPTVKASRMKKKAEDAAVFERQIQKSARRILEAMQETLQLKKNLMNEYGIEEVEKALEELRGKNRRSGNPNNQPMRVMASEVSRPNPTERTEN